jgi:hypothetical protein
MAAGNDDKLNDLASVQLDALKKPGGIPSISSTRPADPGGASEARRRELAGLIA